MVGVKKDLVEFVDTHCHIHEAQYQLTGDDSVRAIWLKANKPDPDVMIRDAARAGVQQMICVGTTLDDSQLAIEFVQNRPGTWASIGIHPHEAKQVTKRQLQHFAELATKPKVVAVGETGLDYYYNHSPKTDQQKLLRWQIELALEHKLPLIFHVREAFDDFWAILDSYPSVRGVVHSFSATVKELDQILSKGLFVGLNGIMTFTKDDNQLTAAKAVPLQKLLLETDAPFLTPTPFRGTICEPRHVRVTAEFLANLRGESLEKLAEETSRNAQVLFKMKDNHDR